MAFTFGTGLSGFMQGYQQAEEQRLRRQQIMQQLQQAGQQARQQQQQQAGATALGNLLAGTRGSSQGMGGMGGGGQTMPFNPNGGVLSGLLSKFGLGGGGGGNPYGVGFGGPTPPMPGQSSQPNGLGYPSLTGGGGRSFQPPPSAPQASQRPGGMSEQQIINRESGGNPFVGWGGTGKAPINLANAPLDPQGFPTTPARPGPQGPSTAGGLYGITKTNWDAESPKVAQNIGHTPQFTNPQDQRAVYQQMRSQYGDKPWTVWSGNAGQTQGAGGEGGAAPPAMPPPPKGYDLSDLAKQLKAANPDLDGATILEAVEQYSGLMDKQSQVDWERYKFQVDEQDKALDRSLQGRRLDEEDAYRRQMMGDRGWQVLTDPANNNQPYRFQAATGQAFDFQGNPYTPGGAQKVGGAQTQQLPELKYPDKWEGMPDKPPPGVREDIWDNALVFARTHQMPAMGFQPGMRNQIIQAYPAALHALGIDPSRAPDVAAAYAGERHGEVVGGGRAAQIGLGIQEAEKAAPQVVETSKGVPRTAFPSVNSFTNWLQQQGGGANVVAFREALNTYLNVYASVVSRTGQLTDAQQRHAYELLSTSMNQGQIERGIQQLDYEMQLMQGAVEPAMEGISQIGQPPAMRNQQQPQAPGTPQAAPTQSASQAQGVPVPAENMKDPDGTRYQGSDGQTYVKRGDMMVPEGR